ncbi:DUF2332 domain-containing protein [Demequina sp.]|uniref:DUF2332 domain-containing protein n=1 Tax=Demequina sp. TaxID=2050685 RepID=UPI0025BFA30A|nr:DUF2332 domain-containing protein [Demequina sp.]
MDSPAWRADNRADLDQVARSVTTWIESALDSPLYAFLASRISQDPQMLALVGAIDNAPPLNLLFAGVQLRLNTADPLAAWYPHLAGADARPPDADAYAAFSAYALDHAAELIEMGSTRRTQTNEVGRSAAILPWLVEAADAWGAPVHLVDIGASAGLNLCLDRFDYDYGDKTVSAINPSATRLTLQCENRGGFALPDSAPAIATRTGLDLAPIDAMDADATAWLEALVWPEHTDRLERLRAALAIRRDTDVRMVAGDAAVSLLETEANLPPGPMLVFHTVMAYQLAATQRDAIDASLAEVATRRPVARVAMEPVRGAGYLYLYTGLSYATAQVRAGAHAHGRWIDNVA